MLLKRAVPEGIVAAGAARRMERQDKLDIYRGSKFHDFFPVDMLNVNVENKWNKCMWHDKVCSFYKSGYFKFNKSIEFELR